MKKEKKIIKFSSNDNRHPYLMTFKWDGPLAFWRGSNIHSDKAKAYFESCLKRWKEKENNMANLTNKIQ